MADSPKKQQSRLVYETDKKVKQLKSPANRILQKQHGQEYSASPKFQKELALSYNVRQKKNIYDQLLINVRFVISGTRIITAFKIRTTIGTIKNNIRDVLGIEENIFHFEIDNKTIRDDSTLADLGANPHSVFVVHLIPKQGETEHIIAKIRENIPTVDVITVHMRDEECGQRDIIVDISYQCPNKEWLGGFRNNLTNTEYYNAIAQTEPRLKCRKESSDVRVPVLFHRDTQTPFKPVDATTHTTVNQLTQTYRPDLHMPTANDKVITAGNYIPVSENWKMDETVQSVIIIQRAVKKWIHSKKLQKLIKLYNEIREEIQKQKSDIHKEEARKEREIITGAAFPVNRDDFYMLYLMVGNWWREEWKRICAFSKESKQAESNVLLVKEVQLLKEIERQRVIGKKEGLKKANITFLEKISSPIIFTNANGDTTSIDDLPTQRAREFKEIYTELIRTNVLPKERIAFLLTFKQLFLSEYADYEYANDLIKLTNREIDLLTMGIKFKDLKGLRRRIEQLFISFLNQEEYNPKCAKYKEPHMPKTLNTLFQCTRCRKLLPASKYPVHVRMRVYDVCSSCTWLKNIGFNRVDMSPYIKLLNAVRNFEMDKCCLQAVCFILQPIGMFHLTTVIWHGRSAISENSDMTKLQHVRWLSHLEWAPWNTILLTNQEAKCHSSIQNVFQFYDKLFIEKVKQRHVQALMCFETLLEMNHDLCSSGDWLKVRDSGVYLHPSNAAIFNSVHDYDKL